jgi:hypothetical protein
MDGSATSPALAEPKVFDIRVAVRVIRHISSGIYRTPAGALKELVSNAFDSQASRVWINTDHPRHRTITVEDDGNGMTEEVAEITFRHVGASLKTADPGSFPVTRHRRIVGMFGIGLLASAHISKKIQIMTHPRSEDYSLRIDLDLAPYFQLVNQTQPLEEFTFGTVSIQRLPRVPGAKGTRIVLADVERDSNFYKALTQKSRARKQPSAPLGLMPWPHDEHPDDPPGSLMAAFVRAVDEWGVSSVTRLEGREYILWELALITPIAYLDGGPVERRLLKGNVRQIVDHLVEQASSWNFKVVFDGVELRKPIRLPTKKRRVTKADARDLASSQDFEVVPIKIDFKTKQGTRVVASGYVLWQPYNVVPEELRGLYTRVSGVGLGPYDNSLYRSIVGEDPLMRVQVSGELWVEEGLAEAINIDRSGFIELDSDFQEVKSRLSNLLGGEKDSVKTKVKHAKVERENRRWEQKRSASIDEATAQVTAFLGQVMKSYSIRSSTWDVIERRRPGVNYRSISVYPSLLVDHRAKRVLVDFDELPAKAVLAILTADEILGSLPNGPKLRRRLAEMLAKAMP